MDKLISVLEETNRLLAEHLPRSPIDLPVVISILALLAAVGVPSYIAYRQNKIALFEKRSTAYFDLLKLKTFADMFCDEDSSFDPEIIAATGKDLSQEISRRRLIVLVNFQRLFYAGAEMPKSDSVPLTTLSLFSSIELSVHTLPMLYSKHLPNNGKDVNTEISQIFNAFSGFMYPILTPNATIDDESRKNFVSKTQAFFDKYADLFEDELRL